MVGNGGTVPRDRDTTNTLHRLDDFVSQTVGLVRRASSAWSSGAIADTMLPVRNSTRLAIRRLTIAPVALIQSR